MRLTRALSIACTLSLLLVSAGHAQEGGSDALLARLREEDARAAVSSRRALLAALVRELARPGQLELARHRLRAGIDQVAGELVELTGAEPGAPWEPARQEAQEARAAAARVGPPPRALCEHLNRFAEFVRQRLAVKDAEERVSRRAQLEPSDPPRSAEAQLALEDELWEAKLQLGTARQRLERIRAELEQAHAGGYPPTPAEAAPVAAPPAQAAPAPAPSPPQSKGILGALER